MAGLYFEEFTIGRVFDHAWTRTVTEMDNVLFSSLTMNVQPPAPRRGVRLEDRVRPAHRQQPVHARPDDRHHGQ
jgi:hypothetical protein